MQQNTNHTRRKNKRDINCRNRSNRLLPSLCCWVFPTRANKRGSHWHYSIMFATDLIIMSCPAILLKYHKSITEKKIEKKALSKYAAQVLN